MYYSEQNVKKLSEQIVSIDSLSKRLVGVKDAYEQAATGNQSQAGPIRISVTIGSSEIMLTDCDAIKPVCDLCHNVLTQALKDRTSDVSEILGVCSNDAI
jgi:hypothetical protein